MNSNVSSFYTPNSELVLERDGGCKLTVKVIQVFTPFSSSQVSLVRLTNDIPDLPSVFIVKTFDPRFDSIRFTAKGENRWPWSLQAEAEAEDLRRRGIPKQTEYDFPDRNDPVGVEEYCFKGMDCDCSGEVEAYLRLQAFQGHHIPKLYGEANFITTDVRRAIIPRSLLIQYIPNAVTIDKISKDLVTTSLAKSFFHLLKSFHALGVIHNDLHHDNILVADSSENLQARAVFIDFGEVCLRDGETDEEWAKIVRCLGDERFMRRQLQKVLGTEDVACFIDD
ncbi:hypothetical protein BD410DRAFT_549935 [Rickenella mellea]|uniref:Protein kinase domain-containing protein n=1 Tax=Rickenella mellea TaxID=50990 RepID=A0A4Y7PQR2_9AGAM|nr:hypothetical protein BD410DRAFT_549935 [Rickenella mellea]